VTGHLFTQWDEVEPLIRDCDVMLFLDYDGTLAPIVRHPALAKLSLENKKLLQGLSRTEDLTTAIVSGRSLAQLKRLVGLKRLIYIGNHGLECEGPPLRFVHPEAVTAKSLLKTLTYRFKQAFKSFPRIFVENKGLTMSVHYRELAEVRFEEARAIFLKMASPHLNTSRLVLSEGKKVWELRPPVRWNKGTMILWLLARRKAESSKEVQPIYVGDDQTDEDAFKALKGKGIGIKINESLSEPTEASYFLNNPEEVSIFLKRILTLKNVKKKSYVCP